MRILIIDQCSGSKEYPDGVPVYDEDTLEKNSLQELLERDDAHGIEARELYTGRQQGKIDEAVRMLRTNGHKVDRYFISAGFGLVGERDRLPPYNMTFADMSPAEVTERAGELGIPTAVREVLRTNPPYDVVFFALGKDYYRGINLDTTLEHLPSASIGVVFNRESSVERFPNVVSIPARTEDAKEYGTIVVALKGLYLKNFARELGPDTSGPNTTDLVKFCTTERSSQAGFDEFN